MDWLTLWASTGNNFTEDFKRWVESETDGVPDPQTFSLMLTEAAQAYMVETGKQAAPSWSMFNIPGVQSDFKANTSNDATDEPPVKDVVKTDPLTGWQTGVGADGKLYVNKPFIKDGVPIKDKTGQQVYQGWELLPTAKTQFQPNTWARSDGSWMTGARPADAVGYVDENGIPQQLDELFRSSQTISEPARSTTDPGIWNPNTGRYDSNPFYVDPNDAIAAQRQTAIDAENQKMNLWNIQRDLLADADKRYGREWEAIQTRQSAQAAQDMRDAAALNEAEARWSQPDAPKFTSNAPVDWISVWKANQQPNQAGQRQSAFGYYDKMLNGAQTAKLAQDTGTSLERQNIWDNAAQAYRKETDFEFDYRTRVQPIRQMVEGTGPASAFSQGIQEYSPAQANIQWGREQGLTGNAMDAFTNAQREYKPVGPQRPGFLSGVVGTQNGSVARLENVGGVGNYNPWKNQINLNTLGRTGNAVAPVSAQMYQGWTPSQQQGYQGLVNSRVRGSVGGAPEDYFANINNMWTASKTGSKATRRW